MEVEEVEVPKVEGVEKVEWVAEVVGFVGVQGEYVVEFGIEGEVVEEMEEEEMEEEEGMGLASVLVPVEGEAVEGEAERHWRYLLRGRPRGVMVKAMNCGIVVREFILQSRYYVHFRTNTLGKGMNPLILPPAMGK